MWLGLHKVTNRSIDATRTFRGERLPTGAHGCSLSRTTWGWHMGRVHIEEHNGHRIVVSDCRNCTPAEIVKVCEEVMAIVTAQPQHSISTLTDFTGAHFDKESVTRLKVAAAFDRPHIVRAAFIGTDTLPDVYHKAVENFSARRFATFSTREEALRYLTDEEAEGKTA